MTFQRARSEEQREIRRRAILDTAASMLDEMPVADVSLNELSRRAGLAKSALSRYFESREAVLLELLDYFLQTWLAELPAELAAGVDANLPAEQRAARLAETLSRSLADRPVLCDLFGAQGGVLEHNITLEVALRHKRTSLEALATMTDLIHRHLPELGDGAQPFCLLTMVLAGALSAYCPPPPAVLAVYEADPSLAVVGSDLRDALRQGLGAALLGVLPRTG
ncbi:TetR/AcrR family transcriptional regulator [Amycolatopsis sp. OK19-0408]|uniref:TetR/AcrR family transcriptional regulator n=1 Tax=Amycolatopsis iheyensis TaxID=2945988 RepID=A0A9X2SHK4_9PSEU|nr:TetR/AcrR family transcriptional regulator [Amycolatopsis iheyensis]MCR6482827.1 TetR/AcrR family transcriptional regulator [Amycolatopsis iheyensis]